MTGDSRDSRPVKRFFGALLMAVGGLIVGLCGLCTVNYMLMAPGDPTAIPAMLFLAAIFGGVPIVVGVYAFICGRHLWRGAPPPL